METKPDVQLYGTSDLCFDKDIFMRPDFNVDDFMREYQCMGDANLETLRDHLGVYLKILRSAMIDLINRDYADFVNLSTNLTGFDSLIQALTVPLGQLREEVLSVYQLLESASRGVLTDLEKQKNVQKYKKKLTTFSDIAKRLGNLEEMVQQSGFENGKYNKMTGVHIVETSEEDIGSATQEVDAESTFHNLCLEVCSEEELLERFAAELSYLKYLATTCEGTKLLTIYKPHIIRIELAVEASIERNLKAALCMSTSEGTSASSTCVTAADTTLLRRTLVACSVMDCVRVAEDVVLQLLSPTIREMLSDSSVRGAPMGVHGALSHLLVVLKERLAPLLLLTVPQRQQSGGAREIVAGFQFIEHSVFPEVVAALSALPDLYSPANPTAFHQRYLHSLDFLTGLERLLVTRHRVDVFRAQESYADFMEKWNLAVYFQIRNQEIGQVVESSLCEESGLKMYLNESPSAGSVEISNSEEGVLGSTRGVLRGVTRCWQPDVYLPPLLHRFWKLTLLSLARHRTWLEDTVDRMQRSDPSLLASTPLHSSTKEELAVFLLSDLQVLETRLGTLYDEHIALCVQHIGEKHQQLIQDTLAQQSAKLTSFRTLLLTVLTEAVSASVTTALRPVTDTPRLYRRTNRSAPRQPQQYVSATVAPLQRLHALAAPRLQENLLRRCLTAVCRQVAERYFTMTSEVLASVSKTEESLRRLKMARGTTGAGQQGSSGAAAGLTDEDKIREQLHLDVRCFGEQLRGLGVVTDDIEDYVRLLDAVTVARTAVAVQ